MEVTVSGRHTTVSEGLRQQAIDKIGRLDRLVSGMDKAEVHFWEEKNPKVRDKEYCEVTIEGHGHHIRTKVAAPNGFVAIDLAVDKLERQLRKLKTRLKKRNQGRDMPEFDTGLVPDTLLPEDEAPDPVYNIVKKKKFKVALMDPESAALEMDLLNHDFYVFRNDATGLGAVVYRREDGNIGLIDVD